MKKKKILYLMTIDWQWIKQRPQYVAIGLNENYKVYVLYEYDYNRERLQKKKNEKGGPKTWPIYLIKNGRQFKAVRLLNVCIKKIVSLLMLLLIRPDYIYITYPEQLRWVEPFGAKHRLFYDCMDDHCAMNQGTVVKKYEEKLLKKCNKVFFTSNELKKTVLRRYGIKDNGYKIIRNGYDGEIVALDKKEKGKSFNVCYVGTVGAWFDSKVIMESLLRNTSLEYWIIGPVDIDIEQHPRMHLVGIVEHDQLYEYTKKMDCFVMPFMLNDVVKSVDPVKFYEYINWGKNIVSVYYEEIERYKNYVHFYSSIEEYCTIMEQLTNDNTVKYSEEERVAFLKMSSWNNRVYDIANVIESKSV